MILALLFICGLIALWLQSFVTIIAYPIGALFFYYLTILLFAPSLKDQFTKKIVWITFCFLILMPIVWLLIAPEYFLFNLLMPKLNMDMK